MTDASSSIVVLTPHATITTTAITIHNYITHKLSKDNYRLWKATIVPILRGHSVYGFVNGTIKPLPQTIEVMYTIDGVETVEKKSNPKYATWNQQDQLIMGALTSSLTESILIYVLKCTTSPDLWFTLEHLFTSHSQARLMQVHLQLATLKKGDSSIFIFKNSQALWILLLLLINHSMILSSLHFSLLVLGQTTTLLSHLLPSI